MQNNRVVSSLSATTNPVAEDRAKLMERHDYISNGAKRIRIEPSVEENPHTCTSDMETPLQNKNVPTRVSRSEEISPYKNQGLSDCQNSEDKYNQVLLDVIYGFCEDLSLTVRTAHYAVSISKTHLKHLKSSKPRRKKYNRRKSHHELLRELASASLLISCRHFNNGITLKQVSKATEVKVADIVSRKKLIDDITCKTGITHGNNLQAIVTRACNVLVLSPELSNTIQVLAEGTQKLDTFQGIHCSTIVASCIFLVLRVTGAKCSKEEISAATCVPWSSIRSFYKRLLQNAEDLLPEDFTRDFATSMDILVLDKHRLRKT